MELTVNDLCHVYEAVYPARTSWYNIGLQLHVPVDTLDSIDGEKGNDGDHLRNMLKRWLKQSGATWRALSDALKSPTVEEYQLAKKLDVRARGQVSQPQSESIEGASILSTQEAVVSTRSRIEQLEEKYHTVVTTTQEVVRRKAPSIEEFRTTITLLPSSVKREQQQYLRDHLTYIYQAKSIDEIFGHLNLQVWNYLNFGLLECIVAKYGDPTTKEMMDQYRASVQSFRKDTPLCVFLKAQPKGKCPEISPGLDKNLQEVRFKHHSLSLDSTLEDVECIRRKLACELALPDFVVVLTRIELGCISIVWTLPTSLTAVLKDKIENESFQSIQWSDVVEVAIAGTRIYQSDTSQESPGRVETSQAVGITSPTVKQELKPDNDPAGAVSTHLDLDRPFEVEDMAKVGGAWYGVVRWIGRIDKLGDGDIAGLEMDDEVPGGSDGEFRGKKYFTCPSGHGLYLPVKMLQRFNPDELQLPENDGDVFVEGTQKSVLVSDSDDQVEKDTYKEAAVVKAQSQSLEATLPVNTTPMEKQIHRSKSSPDYLTESRRLQSLSQNPDDAHDTGSSTAANDEADSNDSDEQMTLTFLIPGDRAGLIIGRDGQNIREVQDATSTKIHIDRPGYGGLRAKIVGKKIDCNRALLMILQNLNRKIACYVETMIIPNRILCGRIIGRKGLTRHIIESLSGARVKINQKEGLERLLDETATCRITGSAKQIEKAKILIKEAMQGEDVARMATFVAVLSMVMKKLENHNFKFYSKDLDSSTVYS